MGKHYIWRAEEILNYGDPNYESRLLLDSKMAGEPCVNVNHGTLPPKMHTGEVDKNGRLYGPAHAKAEIYFGVSGEADLFLNGEKEIIRQGTLVYIPAGTEHYLVNRSETEKFCLLTMWPDEKDNEVWHKRIADWGEGYEKRKMPGVRNK